MQNLVVNDFTFVYSTPCDEYQYQTVSHEEYINVQMALISNGYILDEENEDYAYFTYGHISIYVERNY